MKVADLFAQLSLKPDRGSFRGANRLLGGIQTALAGIVAFKTAGAVGSLIGLASDAAETTNVINQSFEEAASSVERWAQTASRELGRSRFAMREMAAATGAILQPMLGSSSAAADMSTQMAQLAVDLGSFFNTTDADALRALQAGMVGSMEPLLRYGVVMKQVNLEEFRRQKGIRTSVKDMNEAELTALRFNFIMERTAKAQGDAARTSDGYANASKRLRGLLRDLATTAAQRLLPIIEKYLNRLIGWISANEELLAQNLAAFFESLASGFEMMVALFEKLAENQEVVQAILLTIIGLFTILAVKATIAAVTMAASWAAAAAPLLAIGAIVAALFGEFGTLFSFIENNEAFRIMAENAKAAFRGIVSSVAEAFTGGIQSVQEGVNSRLGISSGAINKLKELHGSGRINPSARAVQAVGGTVNNNINVTVPPGTDAGGVATAVEQQVDRYFKKQMRTAEVGS